MTPPKLLDKFPAGIVTMPPSKSVSHRGLICAGIAALQGTDSLLYNVGDNEDIAATRRCLTQLGVCFAAENGGLRVYGGVQASNTGNVLDCGESGSTLRFLIPLCASGATLYTFTGHGRLMDRPLSVYETLFAQKGLRWERSPTALRIQGPLKGGDFALPGDVSSQFLSGLLFALPLSKVDSRIRLTTPLESAPYVALTLDMLRKFGIQISRPAPGTFLIPGGQRYQGCTMEIEGDFSQSAFFLGAGALGCPVSCGGLPDESSQGDRAILTILKKMGVSLRKDRGVLTPSAGPLSGIAMDMRDIPDLVPPVSALCCFAAGTSKLYGAARLRLKESDRLSALATELCTLGADMVQTSDGLVITGQPFLRGGTVDAHNDHRIAMTLAVAAIRCKEPVVINGWTCTAKSYPAFWQDFEQEVRK